MIKMPTAYISSSSRVRYTRRKKIEEGILVDLDEEGKIYGIEIVGVSERMSIASLGKINIDVSVSGVPA